MNLVELGKICGILFFVVMCWYFVFVVFKTNKEYLKSLAGMNNNFVEEFTDDQMTKMENNNSSVEGSIKSYRNLLGLGDGGKQEKREQCLKYIKNGIRLYKLTQCNDILSIATDSNSQGNKKEELLIKNEKMIKIFEDALTYFTEEQTISEHEGLI